MKPNILKIAAILLVLVGGLASCRDKEKDNNRNNEDKDITLSGTFVETYPVPCPEFAMKITFIDSEKLILESSVIDEFKYEIRDSSIVLTLMNVSELMSSEYDFRVINNRKFEMGSLHGRHDGDTLPNMIFEKEN